MNDLLNNLLGLDGLQFGQNGAGIGWAHPIPAWGWLLVVLGAIALSAWSYARLEGPRLSRVILSLVRAALLVLLAVAAAGPRLQRERSEVERDRLAVLIDRSASIGISDARGQSRDDELKRILEQSAPTWAELTQQKDMDWLAFGGGVSPLDADGPGIPTALPPADRPRTAIGTALDESLRRAAGRPLSGIVIFSDGRSADSVSNTLLADLRSDRVPVHVVPIGSDEAGAEFAVVSAEAPAVAFVDDVVPVTVRFDHTGVDPARAGRLEIIETGTGLVIETAELSPDMLEDGEATVPVETDSPGEQRWTVKYVSEGPDLSSENNSASVAIRLVDEPIRVLYVDGSPRWEQRFLKSLLIREDSVDSSCLLMAVNRRYQQEGDTLLETLPRSADEWAAFDVVIIGDVRPELLGDHTLEEIRSLVGQQAAGLLWLAGPSATPAGWGETALTDLLPIDPEAPTGTAGIELWDQPVVLHPTRAAERTGLFADLLEDHTEGGVTDPDAGWSGLRWALRLQNESLKASAEVLAWAEPVDGTQHEDAPLVVSMRYGSGRVALVGTDEIWRWRYGQGEPPTERFWLPLLRSLARPRLASIGRAASLEVSPSIAGLGDRVAVRVTITDQSIAEVAPREFEASVTQQARTGQSAPAAAVRLVREPGSPAGRTVYAGSMPALRPGKFIVNVPPDALSGVGLEAGLEVISGDDEMRNPQTDHAFLADLAERTGGRVLSASDLAGLAGLLPNRRVIVPLEPEIVTLWDTPLMLALLLGLATLEWVWRRLIRLS